MMVEMLESAFKRAQIFVIEHALVRTALHLE